MAGTSIIFDLIGRDRASDKFNNVGNSADGAGGKMAKFGKLAKMAALGLAAGVGAAAVGVFKLTQGAIEDSAAQAKLAKAMENAAGASKQQIAATEDWISAQGRALGVTDDELRPALQKLVGATGDVGKAQRLASLAMDVSAGSGKSMEAVSTALAKAQNGQVAGLSKLGISTKNAEGKTISFKEATRRLAELHEGQASEAANTTAGKFNRLKLVLSEAGEEVGGRLIPVVTKMADWFLNKGVPAVSRFGDYLGTVLPPYLNKAKSAFTAMGDKIRPIGDWFREHPEVIKGIGIAFGVAAGAALALGIALGVVAVATSPITLAVLAVAALGGAIAYAWKNSQTFRTSVTAVGAAVQQAMGAIRASIPPVIATVRSLWASFGPAIVAYLRGSFQNAVTVLRGAFTVIRGIFKTVSSLLKGDWKGMWDGIKTILRGYAQLVTGIVRQLWNGLKAVFRLGGTVLKAMVRTSWAGIQALTRAGVNHLVSQVRAMPGRLMAVGRLMLRAGGSLIGKLWEGIKSAAGKPGGFISDLLGKIKDGINNLLNLPLKTPTLKVKGVTILGSTTVIPAFRRGGIAPGGLALVGEEGPELVDLPGGSRVTPHRASMARLAGGGGGGDTYVFNFHGVTDSVSAGREIEKVLIKYGRATGRPLQVKVA